MFDRVSSIGAWMAHKSPQRPGTNVAKCSCGNAEFVRFIYYLAPEQRELFINLLLDGIFEPNNGPVNFSPRTSPVVLLDVCNKIQILVAIDIVKHDLIPFFPHEDMLSVIPVTPLDHVCRPVVGSWLFSGIFHPENRCLIGREVSFVVDESTDNIQFPVSVYIRQSYGAGSESSLTVPP